MNRILQLIKKSQIVVFMPVILLCLALFCMCVTFGKSAVVQSTLPIPMQQQFIGFYSFDGVHWQPLEADSRLSASEGDLILRGHFAQDMPSGVKLNYYSNHIGVSMYANGACIYADIMTELQTARHAVLPDICGRKWETLFSQGISTEDMVEIHLINPHKYGNESAYHDFLDTLCCTPINTTFLQQSLEQYGNTARIIGSLLLIASIMLLGSAITLRVQYSSNSLKLFQTGLLSLFSGGYITLDTIDACFWMDSIMIITYICMICMMLGVFWVGMCLRSELYGKWQHMAGAGLCGSALVNAGCMLVPVIGNIPIYNTLPYWAASQAVLCPLLLVCGAVSFRHTAKESRIDIASYMLLLSAVLLDLAGVGESMLSHGTCTKIMFLLMFVVHIIRLIRMILMNQQAAARVKLLEQEVEDSRIAIMLSQIQPHFLYNCLTSIAYLCEKAPKEAKALTLQFSEYLRGSLRLMEQNTPVPFSEELEHMQNYLYIEQVRFGEKIKVQYDLETTSFKLPALTLQPLVENAVKHGISKKTQGGTVVVITRELEEEYVLQVQDDGIGFDLQTVDLNNRQHVGLRNVERRLEIVLGAAMQIESVPNEGTTVTVRIPKKA